MATLGLAFIRCGDQLLKRIGRWQEVPGDGAPVTVNDDWFVTAPARKATNLYLVEADEPTGLKRSFFENCYRRIRILPDLSSLIFCDDRLRRAVPDWACRFGYHDILYACHAAGVKGTSRGADWACRNNHPECLRTLIEYRVFPTPTGADWACRNNRPKLLRLCLDAGVFPSQDEIERAMEHGAPECRDILREALAREELDMRAGYEDLASDRVPNDYYKGQQ